jgi:hypothetical protein
MYTPPGTLRSRSFTRLTMRVGLPHLGQSVDFVVSMIFLRSPVFAIFAIGSVFLLQNCLCSHASCSGAQFRLRLGGISAASTARPLLIGQGYQTWTASDLPEAQDSLLSVYMSLPVSPLQPLAELDDRN